MISVLAWIVLVVAAILLALAVWRRHVSRPGSSAFWWFVPMSGNGRGTLAAFVVATAAWQVASDLVANPTILPAPAAALRALWDMATWELLVNVLVTLRRVAIAFTLATLAGVGLGLAAGLFPWVGKIVLPLNSALRYTPPTAFIGLTIVWFGVYEGSKLALIVIAVLFYIIQMTVDVTRAFPRSLAEAALNLGATDWETFGRVIFPYCLPGLLAVLRVNMGAAWTFVIVAEVISAQNGIGHLMAVSQRFLATPQLFALLFLVGVLGYASDAAFTAAIRLTSPWKN
jgi:NitT/TauT family transport system permease protein